MAAPSVFLISVTADYPAALAVYQLLREREIACFFCDEALLRAGEAYYRPMMHRALREASHLLVLAGQASHASSPSVQEALEAFQNGALAPEVSHPIITLTGPGVSPGDLPEMLQSGRIFSYPDQLDILPRLLTHGETQEAAPIPAGADDSTSDAPIEAKAKWNSRRVLWAVTLLNAGLFFMSAWMLRRAGIPSPSGKSPAASSPAPSAGWNPQKSRTGAGADGVKDAEKLAGQASGADHRGLARSFNSPTGSQEATSEQVDPLSPRPSAAQLAQAQPGAPLQHDIGNLPQVFSFLPAGTFLMGSPQTETGHRSGETQRPVTVAAGFWLARTECPQELWTWVMGTSMEDAPDGPGLPIRSISWQQITGSDTSFLALLNLMNLLPEGWRFDLPDEAQWEYACRAGTTTPFSFGSVLDGTQANCDGRLAYGTSTAGPFLNRVQPIASYLPNDWDLYDMHGNLAEWCRIVSGQEVPRGISPSAPKTNHPIGRGGSWRFHAGLCRSASREAPGGIESSDTIGFRLAIVALR
jgi:formylglycine-generating enzyme required for sulfatase activity